MQILNKIKNFWLNFHWKRFFLVLFLFLFLAFGTSTYFLLGPFKSFFPNIPGLLGFFGERQYLVLLQNNYERRASGGFISSYAVIKTFFGHTSLEIKDSYEMPDPSPLVEPPYPLNKLLSGDKFYKGWVFRDSNWSPDFPTSAQKAISFYDKGINEITSFDGVFALDMELLSTLLEVYGPQSVGGQTFTKENYFYKLQFLSKNIDLHNEEELKNRKNFLKPLVTQLFSEVLKNPSKIFTFEKKLVKLLDEKHFQILFSSESLQNKIQEKGWSGEFEPRAEDYVHFNVANIGGRKADRYLRHTYFYDLDFSTETPKARLKILSEHLGTKSLISDFYQAYYRLYLPKGIENLEVNAKFKDEKKIYEELDSAVVAGLVHLQPGEEFEISLFYDLPKIVDPKNYKLEILPQAGGLGESWHISAKQKTDHFFSSDTFETTDNLARFDGEIFKNKLFTLSDLGDDTPPVVVWQKFKDTDLLEINFSEKIDEEILKDLKNFSLEDLNFSNKQKEVVFVKDAYFEGNTLFIQLDGISYQEGEHYLFTLKNLHDESGNYTSPNPLKITVVQE